MSIFQRLSLNSFYFYLLFATFIETINGYFIYTGSNGGQQAVAAIKLLALALGVVFVLVSSKKGGYMLSLFLVLPSIVLLGQVVTTDFDERSTIIVAKILINVVAIYFFYYCFAKNEKWISKVKWIVILNAIPFLANILLSLAGVGFANYKNKEGEGFGGTGFFYAGNEVGVALIACLGCVLIFAKNSKQIYLAFLVFLACAFAIISKVSLLGVMLVIFAYIFFKNKLLAVSLGGIGVSLFSILWVYFSKYFEFAVNRWLYLIEDSGVLSFVLGGNKRLGYIEYFLDSLADSPDKLLFGFGWVGEAENNFFDMLEGYGVFGLFVFMFWFYLCFKNLIVIKTLKMPSYSAVAVAGCLVALVSLFAGHTVQSSLITPFLAFIWVSQLRRSV